MEWRSVLPRTSGRERRTASLPSKSSWGFWRRRRAALIRSGCPAPAVLRVDATGSAHPGQAGLAIHLGWALNLPTVGVTRCPLRAIGSDPELVRGAWTPFTLDGEVVAASVCTRTGARPVVAHA